MAGLGRLSSGHRPEVTQANPEAAHPLVDGYQLGMTSGQSAAIQEYLAAKSLSGRVDETGNVTTLVLTDAQFRPAVIDLTRAQELAVATGADWRLLRAIEPQPGTTDPGLLVRPDGSHEPLVGDAVAEAVSALPMRASRQDRWLLVGRSNRPGSVAARITQFLSGHHGAAVSLWEADGWFVAQVGAQARLPEIVSGLGAALRRREKHPVVLVRISTHEATVMQPGARRWEEFPLVWGMRRSWVHPRWGVAEVDQDSQVAAFAGAWRDAGGKVDEVNLRALSRRRTQKDTFLRPALTCMGAPAELASLAIAVADGSSVPPPALLTGPLPLSSTPADTAPESPGRRLPVVARVFYGLSAGLAAYLAYHLVAEGVSGWDWAWMVLLGGLALDGVLGALGFTGASLARHDRPALPAATQQDAAHQDATEAAAPAEEARELDPAEAIEAR